MKMKLSCLVSLGLLSSLEMFGSDRVNHCSVAVQESLFDDINGWTLAFADEKIVSFMQKENWHRKDLRVVVEVGENIASFMEEKNIPKEGDLYTVNVVGKGNVFFVSYVVFSIFPCTQVDGNCIDAKVTEIPQCPWALTITLEYKKNCWVKPYRNLSVTVDLDYDETMKNKSDTYSDICNEKSFNTVTLEKIETFFNILSTIGKEYSDFQLDMICYMLDPKRVQE